jgi:hypothetical protein
VFITTAFAISGLLGDGLAAVTITTAMSFTQSVYWCCRTATNVSVSRAGDLTGVSNLASLARDGLELCGTCCRVSQIHFRNKNVTDLAIDISICHKSPEE